MKEIIQGSFKGSAGGNGSKCEFEQMLIDSENEVTINVTIKMKIDKTKKSGQKIVEKMINKQESPALAVLKGLERDRKIDFKEGKAGAAYYVTDEDGKFIRPSEWDWASKKFK